MSGSGAESPLLVTRPDQPRAKGMLQRRQPDMPFDHIATPPSAPPARTVAVACGADGIFIFRIPNAPGTLSDLTCANARGPIPGPMAEKRVSLESFLNHGSLNRYQPPRPRRLSSKRPRAVS